MAHRSIESQVRHAQSREQLQSWFHPDDAEDVGWAWDEVMAEREERQRLRAVERALRKLEQRDREVLQENRRVRARLNSDRLSDREVRVLRRRLAELTPFVRAIFGDRDLLGRPLPKAGAERDRQWAEAFRAATGHEAAQRTGRQVAA